MLIINESSTSDRCSNVGILPPYSDFLESDKRIDKKQEIFRQATKGEEISLDHFSWIEVYELMGALSQFDKF